MTLRHPAFAAALALALSLGACGEDSQQQAASGAPAPEQASAPAPAASNADIEAAVAAATHAIVDRNYLAGVVTMTSVENAIVQRDAYGVQSVDSDTPMAEDTIFAIASMTKPIAGVALMILYDEGKWSLDDPVAKFLPELADMQVQLEDGTRVPAGSEMTMRQLVTHTAGLAYGLTGSSDVDRLYLDSRATRVDWSTDEFLANLATLPLLYQPGEQWSYSIAVDVQGAVIERLSGQSFADFARERIFAPLGMTDTAFFVPAEKRDRLASIHAYAPDGLSVVDSMFEFGRAPAEQPGFSSGGAGLYSTAPDYMRFTLMLLNDGALDGARILSPESARLMHANLLPEALNDGGRTGPGPGAGFGVDFGIVEDPAAANDPRGAGTYYWGGAFGTWFWIDPVNAVTAVGMVQRGGGGPPDPNDPVPDIQTAMRDAVYGALAE